MAPSAQEESTIYAIHRWLELGTSSRTNPVIAYALAEFLTPVGVSTDSFEIPAADMIITGMDVANLINPRFSFDHVDWGQPSLQDLQELRGAAECLFGEIDGRANLEIKPREGMDNDKSVKDAATQIQRLPAVIRDAFDQAVLFVLTACRVLAEEGNEELVESFRVGDDKKFFQLVTDYLREALSVE